MPAVVLQLSDVAFALICSCMLRSDQFWCNPVDHLAILSITLQSEHNRFELLWLWKDHGQCFGLEAHKVQFLCNWSNLPEFSRNNLISTIQLQSSGLQILRSRLREDCKNPKEPFLGIAGHREDCMGSQSTRLGLPSSLGSDLTVSR